MNPVTQAAWAVDSATGNDANDGTPAFPLRTLVELGVRFTDALLEQSTSLVLTGDFSTEDLDLDVTEIPLAQLVIDGGTIQVATGTLALVTPENPATRQPLVLGDAAIVDWSPYAGMNLRMTSGAHVGAICGIDKDLGGGSVRCTEMFSVIEATGATAAATPTVGDTYEIITPATPVRSVRLRVKRDLDPAHTLAGRVTGLNIVGDYSTMDVKANPGGTPGVAGTQIAVFRCTLAPYAIKHAACWLIACNLATSVGTTRFDGPDEGSALFGCRVANASLVNGFMGMLRGTLARAQITVQTGSVLSTGNLAVFDSPGSGIFLNRGSKWIANSGVVYGTNNVNYGVELEPDASIIYQSGTTPTITGLVNDVRLAGSRLAWASTPVALSGARIARSGLPLPDALEFPFSLGPTETTKMVPFLARTALVSAAYKVEFCELAPTGGLPALSTGPWVTAQSATTGFTANISVAPGVGKTRNFVARVKV